MNQTRILVVDDEPEVLDTLKEFLTDRGYAVATAANAHDAESLIESRSVALALLDVGVHGLRLAKKALDEGKPFILMSGAPVVIEMGELGDVMRKPFRLGELHRTIKRLLDAERGRPTEPMPIGQIA
jgi:DNA-binding response OmpR family regulator